MIMSEETHHLPVLAKENPTNDKVPNISRTKHVYINMYHMNHIYIVEKKYISKK